MALALIALGAALILLACIAVAWPWIRLPRIDAEARTTLTECAVVLFTGASLYAVAVATGVL